MSASGVDVTTWLTARMKSGSLMLTTSTPPAWTSRRYTVQLNAGISALTSSSGILWYTFAGVRRVTRSSAAFASAVSIRMTACAPSSAVAGASPASRNMRPTCAVYSARSFCAFASSFT